MSSYEMLAFDPGDGTLCAGQPSLADLDRVAAAGFRQVIDLRVPGEHLAWDEPAEVARRGLAYRNVPVAGPAGFTLEAVRALDAALAEGTPALVHCGSANRVGALFALRAAWLQGASPDQALAVGRAHGLVQLEAAVRARLTG